MTWTDIFERIGLNYKDWKLKEEIRCVDKIGSDFLFVNKKGQFLAIYIPKIGELQLKI